MSLKHIDTLIQDKSSCLIKLLNAFSGSDDHLQKHVISLIEMFADKDHNLDNLENSANDSKKAKSIVVSQSKPLEEENTFNQDNKMNANNEVLTLVIILSPIFLTQSFKLIFARSALTAFLIKI